MITSFKDQGTEDIYHRIHSDAARRTLHPKFWEKAKDALDVIHAAKNINHIRDYRAFRLHKLSGKTKAWYTVSIGYRERIVFRFENGNAVDVFISDNHYGD